MPHFKAFGMMNLQYEVRICHKIHNKGRMSKWQIQVTIFLSGTDVRKYKDLNLSLGIFLKVRVIDCQALCSCPFK